MHNVHVVHVLDSQENLAEDDGGLKLRKSELTVGNRFKQLSSSTRFENLARRGHAHTRKTHVNTRI
jgi:hypothetical protein